MPMMENRWKNGMFRAWGVKKKAQNYVAVLCQPILALERFASTICWKRVLCGFHSA